MAEQQVQLTDLDPEQLQQVKKQLDEVGRGAVWAEWASSWGSTTFPGGGTSATAGNVASMASLAVGQTSNTLSRALNP